jgi:hypothetical protein
MSKEAMTWVAQQHIADVTLMAVLRAIAWGADRGTGQCRQSQAALATEAHVSERSVRAALVVLERLEIITRRPQSKGKYGRSTDVIILALARNFDVSRPAVIAIRKTLLPPLQPEGASGNKKSSNRKELPLQPEGASGEYNPVDPAVPYQEGELTHLSRLAQGETPPPTDGVDLTTISPWGSA